MFCWEMSDAVAYRTKARCAEQLTDAQRCHTSINQKRSTFIFVNVKGAQTQAGQIQGLYLKRPKYKTVFVNFQGQIVLPVELMTHYHLQISDLGVKR